MPWKSKAEEKSSTKWASIARGVYEKEKKKKRKKKEKTTKGFQKTTEHQSKVQEMQQKKIGSTGDIMSKIAVFVKVFNKHTLRLVYEYKRILREIV